VADWVYWVIAAVALAIGELLTPGLFFAILASLAALVTAVVAAAGAGLVVQILVFVIGSVASIGLLRPLARRHIHMPSLMRTGTAALTGTRALVLERVDGDGGRVKIGGEEWAARAYLEGQVLEPGDRVEVVKIEGATALVYN
jgi:membrane protein implicated in regulation of membrane protease activity